MRDNPLDSSEGDLLKTITIFCRVDPNQLTTVLTMKGVTRGMVNFNTPMHNVPVELMGSQAGSLFMGLKGSIGQLCPQRLGYTPSRCASGQSAG